MATFTPLATLFTNAERFDPTISANFGYPLIPYPFLTGPEQYLMRAEVIATNVVVYWPSPVPDATYAPGGAGAVTDVVIYSRLT